MRIADITGMNNAFWVTTDNYLGTADYFETEVSEVRYPSYDHIGRQQYPAKGNKTLPHTGMGWEPILPATFRRCFADAHSNDLRA